MNRLAANASVRTVRPERPVSPGRDDRSLSEVTGRGSPWAWILAWLPEGRSIPEDVWLQRHRMVTSFAIVQALALGVFGLTRGFDVTICVLYSTLVAAPAVLARTRLASRRLRTVSATVSLMFASAVLVDLAGGVTEAHFHFFVMVGIVAVYQDWLAFAVCLAITVLHHAVLGVLVPHAVYGSAQEWRSPVLFALIHGLFVLAASMTHLFAWKSIERQVLSDSLTGLANRLAFIEALQARLRCKDEPVSVLFIDLDDFKAINDSAGHHIGDGALRTAALRIIGVAREDDVVARLGGDEFAVLVHGSAATAEIIGKRIQDALQEPVTVQGREVFIRASIGIADDSMARSRDASDIVRDADLAMYLAKSEGKNQVITYTSSVAKTMRDRAELALDIGHAIELNQLEVHYQPVIDVESGRTVGVEALLRWHHLVRGLISPTEFIPLAEETGAIRAIGPWVLRTAATQVAAWQRSLPECRDLTLAVNLSGHQLAERDLGTIVSSALISSGLDAQHLVLEVTESMLLADLDAAGRQLDTLRALGVHIAIDDFGTGYSSLSYLASLPADQLKIDQSFIQKLDTDPRTVFLVRAILDMARGLGLQTIAEGVEQEAQQDILDRLGCSHSQGYLYSKPLPATRMAEYLTARGNDRARHLREPALHTIQSA